VRWGSEFLQRQQDLLQQDDFEEYERVYNEHQGKFNKIFKI